MHCFKAKKEPFARGFMSCAAESLEEKTGAGLVQAAKEMHISISKTTGLPIAFFKHAMCIGWCYDEGIYMWEPGIDAHIENEPEAAEDYELMREYFASYSVKKPLRAIYREDERPLLEEKALWGGTWIGHAVPDFAEIARLGTDAFREKIEKGRKANPGRDGFYNGLMLTLEAIDILGERFYRLAREILDSGEAEGAYLRGAKRVAAAFSVCPKKPAPDFPSACAVYTMLVTLDGVDSPGHFDLYMIDFWRKTETETAREALWDMWEFFHETRTWNLTIGGSDENGRDLTNELTYEILDATAKFRYQTPNLTLRCHKNTPEELYRRAAQVLSLGMGLPAVYNDEVVCPALESLGIPAADARKYVMNGCNQFDIQGKSHMGLEDGEVNFGKAMELTLNNGDSMKTGRRLGARVGHAREYKTFDDLMRAYLCQLDYLTGKAAELSLRGQRICAEKYFNPFRTLCIEGCIERGRGYKDGGPLYGHGQILAEGIADAADSLAAVKKYVFEEKRFSMETLIKALKADFEGYEDIYALLKNSDLRFGNDIDYVDSIAAEIADHYNDYLRRIPTYRGGYFSGGCSPYQRAAENGSGVAALPNGKKCGEPLYADSIGATPGRDVNGPTALLNSCLKYDHKKAGSGFILNIKLDRELFSAPRGQETFVSLLKAYFAGGGQMMTVTSVSREELLDARENPDKHRDLIVRVGGYSDYFVNLTKELQDNVIARTDYRV